jgi:drug/metabolite transporter (DMT)-like permease
MAFFASSRFSSLSDNLRGAAFMTAAMFGFAVNDVIMKSFGGELNLGQVVMIRGIFATILILGLAHAFGQLRTPRAALQPLVALRALGETAATFFFITALFHLPLANVSAVMQALPLALTLAAAVLLREKVGWRRMAAIAAGFAGVLVILRPGLAGFDIYSLFVLASVIACVVRDLATRQMRGSAPPLLVTLATSVFVTLMGATIAVFEDWRPVEPRHVALLALTSGFLLLGYYGSVRSMRVGEVAFVSPFRYSVLLFTIAGGMIAYGEYPDALTLLGAAIIVASGIYTLYRERVVRGQAITPPPIRS